MLNLIPDIDKSSQLNNNVLSSELFEYDTSSFLSGSKLSSGTRRTYFDLYYNARAKTFTYIRPGMTLRRWNVENKRLFIYYRSFYVRNRKFIKNALVTEGNISPYVHIDIVSPTIFRIFFIAKGRIKKELKYDFRNKTLKVRIVQKVV